MSDTPKKLQADQEPPDIFSVMWFETKLGTRYLMPDMTRDHVTQAHKSLDHSGPDSVVIVTNISHATLTLPKKILKRAGVGNLCFWEES